MNIKYEGSARLATDTLGLDATAEARGSKSLACNDITTSELLVSAFGACIGIYVTEACMRLDLNPAETCIEVAWETARDHVSMGRLHAIVTVPAGLTEDDRSALLQAARNCMVNRSLCNQAKIDVEVR